MRQDLTAKDAAGKVIPLEQLHAIDSFVAGARGSGGAAFGDHARAGLAEEVAAARLDSHPQQRPG